MGHVTQNLTIIKFKFEIKLDFFSTLPINTYIYIYIYIDYTFQYFFFGRCLEKIKKNKTKQTLHI